MSSPPQGKEVANDASSSEYAAIDELNVTAEADQSSPSPVLPPASTGSMSDKQQELSADRSLTPDLESLSSSSDIEDQFYDAPEHESGLTIQDDSRDELSQDDTKHVDKEDSHVTDTLETGKDGGADTVAEHPVGSVEGDFIMVDYPTSSASQANPVRRQQDISPVEIRDDPPLIGSNEDLNTAGIDVQSSNDTPQAVATASPPPQSDSHSQRPTSLGTLEASEPGGESAESAQILLEDSHDRQEEEAVRSGGEVEGGQASVAGGEESPGKDEEKGQVNASAFESLGLLYARSPNLKHDKDLLKPADEVAEDVLETFDDIEADELLNTPLSPDEAGTEKQLGVGYSSSHKIDPGAVFQMEKRAQTVAAELSHVMDNLRNSLHAMTVCTRQSIELHRESIDNLHTIVDTNIKGMYTFMAKFEELNKSLGPLQQIASEIHDVDEKLKILEQAFRVNAPKTAAQSPVKVS